MNRSRRGTLGGRWILVGTPQRQTSTTGGALPHGRASVLGAASAMVALTTEIRAIPSLAIWTLRFAGKARLLALAHRFMRAMRRIRATHCWG
jgi:hypothetical protein